MRRSMHGIWVNEVRGADGASIAVADHGAHLLSWIPAGGREALYLSANSGFGGSAAIRGGVPVIFPQFGERGSGKRHGFARTAAWRLEFAGVENDAAVVRHTLTDSDLPDNVWPHQFVLRYEVAAKGEALRLTLSVANPSTEAWSFNAALHSYWRVDDIDNARIGGLRGVGYLDQVAGNAQRVQNGDMLHVDGEIDRIYGNVIQAGDIRLSDNERVFKLTQQGFVDAVVWNPGADKAAALADLAPGGYRHFVCIEAGAVLQPITLAPGASWQGSQIVSVQPA